MKVGIDGYCFQGNVGEPWSVINEDPGEVLVGARLRRSGYSWLVEQKEEVSAPCV